MFVAHGEAREADFGLPKGNIITSDDESEGEDYLLKGYMDLLITTSFYFYFYSDRTTTFRVVLASKP